MKFQDEELSSEPSVQNVDFIKDIKEIKTRKVWLQIIRFLHLKMFSSIPRTQGDGSWKRVGNQTFISTMSAKRGGDLSRYLTNDQSIFSKYLSQYLFPRTCLQRWWT